MFLDLIAEDLMERRLAELRDRLYHAESLSQEREGDIHVLRSQLNILLSAHTHENGYAVYSFNQVSAGLGCYT